MTCKIGDIAFQWLYDRDRPKAKSESILESWEKLIEEWVVTPELPILIRPFYIPHKGKMAI